MTPAAKLAEALEFYANRDTWRSDSDAPLSIRRDIDGDMAATPGKRARAALTAYRAEQAKLHKGD